ncbi:hypothetical protein G7A72_16455 [Flavobacterium sp. Sr18]|uniref:hypothetical protein n=1 Tax=Flavobacterium sp. Sr18 TaxID=935222 RepID=UPI0013E4EAE0|nr:hypothetical protein [Flavobacterium sp. Sr18]QIH40302.1 hypothetical protein G7A72_16455 [Flavobacterium sp. Sr18]
MERCISWYEWSLHKKQGAASHFRTVGDQTHLYNLSIEKVLSKAYVRTARMPYKSKKLFDMERLHDTLDSKIGRFGSRKHRFNYAKKG